MRRRLVSRQSARWTRSCLLILSIVILAPQWAPRPATAMGTDGQVVQGRTGDLGGVVAARVREANSARSGDTAPFSSFGWTDQTVSGPSPSMYVDIPGPGEVVFGLNTRLALVYSGSPALDRRRSWLSVSMNNTYVGSYLIKGGTSGPQTLTLAIPSNALVGNGYNHLELTFGLRDTSSPRACAADPALTATVYNTSAVTYDIRARDQSAFQPDLTQLPAPFISSTTSMPAHITVGLPPAPTDAELGGIGRVVARFGEDAADHPPTVSTTLAASLVASEPKGDLLLVGTPADNLAIAQLASTASVLFVGKVWRDAQGRPLPPDQGLIVEAPNPWDPHAAALMVTANGQEGIRRAAAVLSSAALRGLLHGTFTVVSTMPALPSSPPPLRGALSLFDLGVGSTTVEGSGEQATHVNFDLQQLPTAGVFTLSYGHGANIDPAASSVRIDLNNRPLASRSLGSGDPPRIRWRIPLPSDQLRLGSNVLTVRFFLTPLSAACVAPPYSSIWGIIDGSSVLTFSSTTSTTLPNLGDLPYPLVSGGDPRNTVLVVPPAVTEMGDTLNLAALLGAQSKVDAPHLMVLPSNRATPDLLRGRTVLLDGVLTSDPLVRGIQARLLSEMTVAGAPLPTTRSGTLGGATLDWSNAGIVEELPSPWDTTRIALYVSSGQSTLLSAVQQVLFNGALSGTVAIVDAAGHVQSFGARASVSSGVTTSTRRAVVRPIHFLTATGLGLLLFVLAAMAAREARRDRRML